jgi:hypothetical protein
MAKRGEQPSKQQDSLAISLATKTGRGKDAVTADDLGAARAEQSRRSTPLDHEEMADTRGEGRVHGQSQARRDTQLQRYEKRVFEETRAEGPSRTS